MGNVPLFSHTVFLEKGYSLGMKLVTLARKNLMRHRIRSILTILGIAVSALTLFSILSFNGGYDEALKEEVNSSGVHMYLSMEGCPMQAASLILHGGEIPTYLDEALFREVKGNPEVRRAGGMLISTVISGNKADLFYGLSDEVKDLKTNWELNGRWFTGPNSVILGYDLARDFNKKPGDKILIQSLNREFEVAGTLRKNGNDDDGFYFLPLDTAQEIFSRPNQLTVIEVQLKDTRKLSDVKSYLERRGAYVVPASDITEVVTDMVGSTKSMMLAIVVIVLIVAGLGIFNTVLMATFERNEEFGYLRCVGAQKRHVFALISMETLMLCLVGAVIGIAAGFGLSYVFDGWIRGLLAYAPAGRLLRPNVLDVVLTVSVVIVMGVLAGVYPGIRASRVSPVEAVHNE
jgi:putative ABC transport system permease protein